MLLKEKKWFGCLAIICALATPWLSLSGQLAINDFIFVWYPVVPAETWVGRAVILTLGASGVLLLVGGFRFQTLARRPYRWTGWALLLGGMVLGSVEIRMDTRRIERGTDFQVYLRSSEMRLL